MANVPGPFSTLIQPLRIAFVDVPDHVLLGEMLGKVGSKTSVICRKLLSSEEKQMSLIDLIHRLVMAEKIVKEGAGTEVLSLFVDNVSVVSVKGTLFDAQTDTNKEAYFYLTPVDNKTCYLAKAIFQIEVGRTYGKRGCIQFQRDMIIPVCHMPSLSDRDIREITMLALTYLHGVAGLLTSVIKSSNNRRAWMDLSSIGESQFYGFVYKQDETRKEGFYGRPINWKKRFYQKAFLENDVIPGFKMGKIGSAVGVTSGDFYIPTGHVWQLRFVSPQLQERSQTLEIIANLIWEITHLPSWNWQLAESLVNHLTGDDAKKFEEVTRLLTQNSKEVSSFGMALIYWMNVRDEINDLDLYLTQDPLAVKISTQNLIKDKCNSLSRELAKLAKNNDDHSRENVERLRVNIVEDFDEIKKLKDRVVKGLIVLEFLNACKIGDITEDNRYNIKEYNAELKKLFETYNIEKRFELFERAFKAKEAELNLRQTLLPKYKSPDLSSYDSILDLIETNNWQRGDPKKCKFILQG